MTDSTFYLTEPNAIEDANLLDSNVTEDDYPAWSATGVYALAERVIVVDTNVHNVYESLIASSSSIVTISIATPAVISWTGHGLSAGDAVKFSTTGALPTNITAGTTYYVIASGLTADAFQISATVGGAAINTSGTQSGVHTAVSSDNIGNDPRDDLQFPDGDPVYWILVSPTNRWKMFDQSNSTQTVNADTIDVEATVSSRINAVFFGNVEAQTINVRMEDASIVTPTLDIDFIDATALDPLITFTRASTATYFDAGGTLRTALANEPRLDYKLIAGEWVSQGLLIEPAVTNLCISSNDLRTAAEGNPVAEWGKSGGDTTITLDDAIGPDGLMSLDAVVENFTTTSIAQRNILFPTTAGIQYVASLDVKKGDRRYVGLQMYSTGFGGVFYTVIIDLDNGTVNSDNSPAGFGVEDIGNGLYRIWVSAVATANTANGGAVRYSVSNSATSLTAVTGVIGYKTYYGFVQVEQGSRPSSFIATNGSAVTRAADVATITGTDFSDFYNASAGTFYIKLQPFVLSSAAGIQASDGTANEIIRLSANTTQATVIDGGVSQVSLNVTDLAVNQDVEIAFAYEANDFALSIDGSAASTDSSGTIPTVDRLQIGFDGTNYGAFYLKRLQFYPDRISNTGVRKVAQSTYGPAEVYNQTFQMYENTGNPSYYSWHTARIKRKKDLYINDLPPYANARVFATIDNTGGDAKCGVMILGYSEGVGVTMLGASVGIQDYSVKYRNDFGDFQILERSFNKRGEFDIFVENDIIDRLQNTLANYRATPILYVATTQYAATWIYGFYRDFDIVVAYPENSLVNIEIEGLT